MLIPILVLYLIPILILLLTNLGYWLSNGKIFWKNPFHVLVPIWNILIVLVSFGYFCRYLFAYRQHWKKIEQGILTAIEFNDPLLKLKGKNHA